VAPFNVDRPQSAFPDKTKKFIDSSSIDVRDVSQHIRKAQSKHPRNSRPTSQHKLTTKNRAVRAVQGSRANLRNVELIEIKTSPREKKEMAKQDTMMFGHNLTDDTKHDQAVQPIVHAYEAWAADEIVKRKRASVTSIAFGGTNDVKFCSPRQLDIVKNILLREACLQDICTEVESACKSNRAPSLQNDLNRLRYFTILVAESILLWRDINVS